jgi:molecular chaperone GrpE
LYSEFENFRRRTSKEKLDLISTANKDLMSDLVPVLDDFERAIKAQGEPAEGEEQSGMGLIQHKMLRILEQQGLKAIEVKAGDVFDVELHEAITQIPAPDESLKGKIVDEVEKGYTLNEKVIRFAKVVVGS